MNEERYGADANWYPDETWLEKEARIAAFYTEDEDPTADAWDQGAFAGER